LAKSIRLTDETYKELDTIKQEIEQEATNATGSPMTMTFDNLVKKLCQTYRKKEDSDG